MTRSGRYPIDRRAGEIERLWIQADALAPDAALMLDQIGITPGWRCIDLGCGPGGITDLLSARAGSTGQVVGFDADPVFLGYARERMRGCMNVEFVSGDAYRTGLARGSFDFAHVRFVASTAGEPAALLKEMMGLTRTGVPSPCIPLHTHPSSSGKIKRCCVDRLNPPPIADTHERPLPTQSGHWRVLGLTCIMSARTPWA